MKSVEIDGPTLFAAYSKGFVTFRIGNLARAADVGESTVRLWARGKHVSEASAQAIVSALAGAASVRRGK